MLIPFQVSKRRHGGIEVASAHYLAIIQAFNPGTIIIFAFALALGQRTRGKAGGIRQEQEQGQRALIDQLIRVSFCTRDSDLSNHNHNHIHIHTHICLTLLLPSIDCICSIKKANWSS